MTEQERRAAVEAERRATEKEHIAHNRKPHAVGLQDLRRRRQRRRGKARGRQLLAELQASWGQA